VTTRARGLSLGDRACLATARKLDHPALTAAWSCAAVDVGISIRLTVSMVSPREFG
jgi:PIN domain nuclease of toxin-antitoxin system